MARPMYENEATKAAELAVVERLCARWKVKHTKLPITYHVDYVLEGRKGPRLWLEVKCRKQWYESGMLLSLNKVMAGQRYSDETAMPFIVAFAVGDDIRLVDLTDEPLDGSGVIKLAVMGNYARDDGQDVEVVCLIPMEIIRELDKL